MDALERCMESLGFCHLQDEPRWAAARVVVQQDIDGYLAAAGAGMGEKRDALVALMQRFAEAFPDEGNDPVLIRSYMRSQLRKIEYDLKREGDRPGDAESIVEAAPPTAPPDSHEGVDAEGPSPVTDAQLQDGRSQGDARDDRKARDPCA